jgi:hypothetical protein
VRPVRRPPRAASSRPSGSCGWTEEFLSVQDPRLELPTCYGVRATGSDVLSTIKQMNADRGEVATAIVREHMRAELPAILGELTELRSRAKRYQSEAHAAGDWTAVRGFMVEQRNGIALALRYSGAANPEEPSAEVAVRVTGELEAFIEHLRAHLQPVVFEEVVRLTAQHAVREPQLLPGH